MKTRPCVCTERHNDACQPFSVQEMQDQLSNMKLKKSSGTDHVCKEHLRHLGPVALDTLLHLISLSWSTATVPSTWRRAVIIPIPKAGKNSQEVSSYRPISLTSNVARLAERMVAARVTHLLERDNAMPAEQVGFRRGHSAEENLGRLIQEVQEGWNRHPPSPPLPPPPENARLTARQPPGSS